MNVRRHPAPTNANTNKKGGAPASFLMYTIRESNL